MKYFDHFFDRPWHTAFILLAFVAASAHCSVGWLQADEHFRVMEVAHLWVYGYASLPWELSGPHPIVSQMLGMIHAPALAIARFFSEDSFFQAAFLRFFSGCVNLARIFAFFGICRELGLRHSRIYTAMYVVAPGTLLLLVRTSQENWGCTFFLLGVWGLLRYQSRWPIMICAALLTFSASCRLQLGLSVAVVGMYFCLKHSKQIKWLALGGVAGLLPMAVSDIASGLMPFAPATNYLLYAASDEGGGAHWGKSSPFEYATGFLTIWYPPYSIWILGLIIAGCVQKPLFGLALGSFFFSHLMISHQELRYLTPMVPIWTIASCIGYERISQRINHRLFWIVFGLFGSISILGAYVPLNEQVYFYKEVVTRRRDDRLPANFTYVGNAVSSLPRFYGKELVPGETMLKVDFLKQLGSPTNRDKFFAVQRLREHELQRVTETCKAHYLNRPFYAAFSSRTYVDGIFEC